MKKTSMAIVPVYSDDPGIALVLNPNIQRNFLMDSEVNGESREDVQSVWILQSIQKINNMLGVTYEGIEDHFLALFT